MRRRLSTFDLFTRCFFFGQEKALVCQSTLWLLVFGSYQKIQHSSPGYHSVKRLGSVFKRSNNSLHSFVKCFDTNYTRIFLIDQVTIERTLNFIKFHACDIKPTPNGSNFNHIFTVVVFELQRFVICVTSISMPLQNMCSGRVIIIITTLKFSMSDLFSLMKILMVQCCSMGRCISRQTLCSLLHTLYVKYSEVFPQRTWHPPPILSIQTTPRPFSLAGRSQSPNLLDKPCRQRPKSIQHHFHDVPENLESIQTLCVKL